MGNIFYKETEEILERYDLVSERISEIKNEDVLTAGQKAYFSEVCTLLEKLYEIMGMAVTEELSDRSLELCEKDQADCYGMLSEKNYEGSFLNPEYAVEKLGQAYGGLMSAVFAHLVSQIPAVFQGRLDILTIESELIVMLYGVFTMDADEEDLTAELKDTYYWFRHDYTDVFVRESVVSMIDPDFDCYTSIIKKADLSDNRYLYSYGEFVSADAIGLADHIRSMEQCDVDAMAATYVEGYRKGFEVCGRDLSIKETVRLMYPMGFERVMRSAIEQFGQLGLACTCNSVDSVCNKQYEYDHKKDAAYFLDKSYVERRLEVVKDAFEKNKELAKLQGGPAVVETFGEVPFDPVNKAAAAKYTEKQNELDVYATSSQRQITNEYIPGDERSFTIIAYPIPSIGKDFKAIFDETVKINNLDYELYKNIQQHIIDTLDKGEKVRITGRGDNHTDITVCLHHLDDPSKQTNFENCVADVNIPVGEVFTSPVLEGTNGTLHVTSVYLNDLCYKNLELKFVDGKITEYTCSNFETEQENKDYIFDNLMFHHETLPLGEFAIGTNTEAFKMGQTYGIADKLPILIAEKTGPHFAVGDTCYSHSEDVPMYNPDGKEVIARDNSCSILRKTDFSKAYFNCHTDITIPYYELGDIVVECLDGSKAAIIEQGRFVVPGTEELNKALD